jgi:hypothetical protein
MNCYHICLNLPSLAQSIEYSLRFATIFVHFIVFTHLLIDEDECRISKLFIILLAKNYRQITPKYANTHAKTDNE